MSSDKKTIQFNPDLFKIPEKKSTRRRAPSGEPKEIRMRSTASGKTSRSHLIRQIRNLQEERYRRMQENPNLELSSPSSPNIPPAIYPEDEFESDFSRSLQSLQNSIAPPSAAAKPPHNNTLHARHSQPSSLGFHSSPSYSSQTYDLGVSSPHNYEMNLEVPEVLNAALLTPPMKLTPKYPAPQYGNLKGGKLPTYRAFHNMTQRNTPAIASFSAASATSSASSPFQYGGEISSPNYSQNDGLMEEIKIHNASSGHHIPDIVKRPRKQKKTITRTFRLGKSKVYPKVSVLVANKTIRNDLANRMQDIKQTPIDQVKRHLVKKGLIKVGSSAPNDVLRKMYESVSMVCGEVNNHNSENLLYNYFNSDLT